jgi:serine/threonine-protein kinase
MENRPRLDDYELLEEIGKGGMGVVFKARQRSLDRIVALKMIRAGEYAGEEERKRFQRDAQAVARLQHANIVQICEVGESQGQPFLALEFVDGPSLAHHLDGTPLPAREAASLLEILARGSSVPADRKARATSGTVGGRAGDLRHPGALPSSRVPR